MRSRRIFLRERMFFYNAFKRTSEPRFFSIMKKSCLFFALPVGALLLAANLSADEIRCRNGAIIVGEITAIDAGVITVKTQNSAAGESKIKQSEVLAISRETPLNVRTANGATLTGPVSASQNDGEITIGNTPVAIADITSSWLLDGKSPEEREAEKFNYAVEYEVGATLTGTTGNTESVAGGAYAQALIKNAVNALKLYVKYNYGKTRDDDADVWTKSADNLHAGFDWSSEFHAPWFWYARTDTGFDRVQNIEFFDVSAAGFGLNVIKEDNWHLSVRGGLSYRYERYKHYVGDTWDPKDDTNTLGLDLGLSHDYAWDWGKVVTEISYVPGFDDINNYYIVHETYLQMQLKSVEQMYFRIGMKNEYRSPKTADDNLDTTYYAQLVFSWK